MSWLVTGGAGYIGAHVVRAFQEVGLDAVVIDDLSSGHREFVQPRGALRRGQHRRHRAAGRAPCEKHDVEGVVHLAGFKYAGVSVDRPLHTYTQNVTGTVNLLEAMERTGVDVDRVLLQRRDVRHARRRRWSPRRPRRAPESPYGESKLIGEWLLRDQARATGAAAHLAALLQRRRLGQHDDIYDTSPHNLFPIVFEALARREDAADQRRRLRHPRRHLRARLRPRRRPRATPTSPPPGTSPPASRCEPVYNLGSGDRARRSARSWTRSAPVTGIDFTPEIGPRRPGDPARIVATGELAARDLDWQMRHTLDDMVRTAWQARSSSSAVMIAA